MIGFSWMFIAIVSVHGLLILLFALIVTGFFDGYPPNWWY